MKDNKDNKPALADKQRIELAKQLEYFYEATRPRWKRLIGYSFVKGLATGFGIFIGGTLVVAFLLWLLATLGQVPFLNTITNQVQQTLEQRGNK